jgi:phage terminase large subunit-like protein
VIAAAIVAGPHVRASCKRHLDDINEGAGRGLVWDAAAALRAIGFFRDVLRLSEGQFEGAPFQLDPSQQFMVGSIFGWKRDDGTRRFRRAFIEEGKGAGKSPLAAGIGLYGLVADNEPGAQIYAAGARKEQANILFQDAVKMARQSPALMRRVTFSGQNPVWNMAVLGPPQNGAFFRPISRESGRSGSGPRPHFALCDEVHEHPDRSTMEILERGFKFRLQPLLLMITNSGTDRKSVCWEEHEHAVGVAHGEIQDDTTFSYVCALDDGDDPLNDPSCWVKANPMLGKIVTANYLADVVAQAKLLPGKLNNILRLHFCIWTNAETAWISREAWEACEDPALKITQFRGKRCCAGLDLSALKDLSAKALVFEDGVDDDGKPKFAAFVQGYTPKDTVLERARVDRAPYDVWAREGFLTLTPGPVIRFDFIAADLVDNQQLFDLTRVAYDRFLIRHFETALDEMGATLPLMEHPQGIHHRKDSALWMPGSIDSLETLILERRIRFAVNPALRSAVASACFWTSPAGLRRFEKQRATGRIDMIVALAIAIGAATTPSTEREPEYQMIFV